MEEMKKRIIYSPEEMVQSVENVLDKLNVLRYDGQYRILLGDAVLERLHTWDTNIRKRKDDPFTVVVIGDFKRGKSTFINALLGEQVVPTDITTETVTFNRISYGAGGNEAVLSGSRRIRLSDNELKREELEKIIAETGEPISRIELKRPCEILKTVTIIDTPGTGDAMKDFGPQVEEYLLQADAVIYLYSVKYPLSQTEQLFLKTAVLPQKYTKLFLIGNYADTAGKEETYQRIRTGVAERIHGLLPGTEIITVSALDELCRQLGEARPCKALAPILEEQFSVFRTMLEKLIADKKDTVIIDRMQRLTTAMLQELNEELEILEKGLAMSSDEAKKCLEELQQQKQASVETQKKTMENVDKMIEHMRGEANVWMQEFLQRMESETRCLNSFSTDDLLKYYSFYCIDLLQDAMNTCLEYHREEIFENLQDISEGLAKELAGSLKEQKGYNFRFRVDNKVWTKGDNVSFAVSVLGSMGTLGKLASLVADGFAGAMRQNEMETKKPEILNQIATQMPGLEASVAATITDLYTKLGENAKKHILDFYQEELEKAEHLVKQSVAVANSQEEQKEKIRVAAESMRLILKEAEAMIATEI